MKTLRIGSLKAERETQAKGLLHVFHMAGGDDARIPAVVINGRGEGPVVNLHAGIHGDEYEGVAAIWKIVEQIKPRHLSGALVATPIVHLAAFAAGTRESPIDGKNLARVFPGDPTGTSTDRLASFFFNEVIMKCDYALGLHSGGFRYKFHPLVEYYSGIRSDVEEKARQMAEAFAIGPFTIVQPLRVPKVNVTCTYAASQNNIPSIEPEMWGEGRCDAVNVDEYVASTLNVLTHLGMIEGEQVKSSSQVDHVEGNWVLANNGGLFAAEVKIHDKVSRNQRLGVIRNDFGEIVEEVRADADGFVGAMRTFAMIRPGDWAVLIMKPTK
jgi:predicted deacylase